MIQQTVGRDLFRIETVEEYPLDHDPLVDQAAAEQDEKKRSGLLNHVSNFDQYNTVILIPYMACVPQFDTMHPSMSLGAFFNDRNLWKPVFISPFAHAI